MKFKAFGFLTAVILYGCAPIPFNTVHYKGQPVNPLMGGRAKLTMISGRVESDNSNVATAAAGMAIYISRPPSPEIMFNSSDQQEFMMVLRDELLRMRVFSAVSLSESLDQADCEVVVTFESTQHFDHMQDYQLDVALTVFCNGKREERKYHIDSNAETTLLQRMNTDAYKGKARAVQKLIDVLVPDIANLAGSTRGSS